MSGCSRKALHVTTLVLLTAANGASANGRDVVAGELKAGHELRICGGSLLLDNGALVEDFSVFQSRFGFLFFYIPDRGLWSISDKKFPGAIEAGSFRASTLEVSVDGTQLRIESDCPILGTKPRTAWVSVDPSYVLEVTNVLIGYGDTEEAPDAWKWQIKSDRSDSF